MKLVLKNLKGVSENTLKLTVEQENKFGDPECFQWNRRTFIRRNVHADREGVIVTYDEVAPVFVPFDVLTMSSY